mgnify:CR=1 FL=1
MARNLSSLSKFLSFLLRHGADEFHLSIDEEGFATVEAVWSIVRKRYGKRFSREDFQDVIDGKSDGKKRLEVVGENIRALYGHGKVREVQYPVVEPPDILLHGTNEVALESIRKEGLASMGRQYVHLSKTAERASNVAGRRTKAPILLQIRAKAAHDDGFVFHQPDGDHFLIKHIPPEYIDFPEDA